MSSPRGIRNHNPGNIEDGPFARACNGYAGTEPEGRFATFAEMRYGIAAIIRLLKVYRAKHGLTTVRGIINRWAPPSENVTSAYVLAVCDGMVQPDADLPDIADTYAFLARGIVRHENGKAAALEISDTTWEDALKLAGFVPPPPLAAPLSPRPEQPEPSVVEQTRVIIEPAAEPPPPPPKEKKMPLPIIAGLAIDALLTSIPSLIRAFGKGERTQDNARLAETVIPLAKAAIGATNEQDLIERLSDPSVVTKIDSAVRENWATISEAGGGGITGAAERNLTAATVPLWKQPAFAIAVLLMPLIYFAAIWTLIDPSSTAEIKTMVVSLVVGGTLGAIVGFFLGSSFTTSRSRGLGATPDNPR
jgi:hypothetical protein